MSGEPVTQAWQERGAIPDVRADQPVGADLVGKALLTEHGQNYTPTTSVGRWAPRPTLEPFRAVEQQIHEEMFEPLPAERPWREYDRVLEQAESLRTHGTHYPLEDNMLYAGWQLVHPPAELIARAKALLEIKTRHLAGEAPPDLIPTNRPWSRQDLQRSITRTEIFLAHSLFREGAFADALVYANSVVETLERLGVDEVLLVDYRYAVAAIHLELAREAFRGARSQDGEFTARNRQDGRTAEERFETRLAEYPGLETLHDLEVPR